MMKKLSVLFVAISFQMAHCRRLSDDMDNDLGTVGAPSTFREHEWVKISVPEKVLISKVVGSHVELECEAMGSPPPTMQWMRGKLPLTANVVYESNFIDENPSKGLAKVRTRLVINHLLPIHNGRYTCVAESGAQVATADINVFVIKKEGYENLNFTQLINAKILGAYHRPRVTLWAPTYMDVIGTNVILPCQAVGNPKPSLMWLDSQGQIIGEGDTRISVLPDGELSIRSLNWNDMGVYNCVVRNSVGEDTAETFLYPMRDSK